jgi:pentatricopeptide repeat protein
MAQGESLGEQAGASETLVVDCLRRSGRFEKALEVIRYAEGGECDPLLRKILAFQRVLLQRNDTACHTVEELSGRR